MTHVWLASYALASEVEAERDDAGHHFNLEAFAEHRVSHVFFNCSPTNWNKVLADVRVELAQLTQDDHPPSTTMSYEHRVNEDTYVWRIFDGDDCVAIVKITKREIDE